MKDMKCATCGGSHAMPAKKTAGKKAMPMPKKAMPAKKMAGKPAFLYAKKK